MPKKSEVYENPESKRVVKVQIRPYDANGNYENLDDENGTLQVKNASAEEVMKVVREALASRFGSKN
ncbi:hypothetical protein [Treponema parvum]|uniref:hypothetical protein n=1 Tax=Treponema parvum TaxID=138851 RepID=UPI001AEC2817|nr:hypothetical protein [Treponema parvum]QTQ17291.1 hypothetical protein HXT04_11685 [Treponema parvum]